MIEAILVIYAVVFILKVFGHATNYLFRPRSMSQVSGTSVSGNWYGICEKCGTKGGLHRFDGKRYCAVCHAQLTAEKNCGTKEGTR